MRKDELNAAFRKFVKDKLSPKETERILISKIYVSFQELLGETNCLQIGSYPRYTVITPVHDLDILLILGNWEGKTPNPESSLITLKQKIEKELRTLLNIK